MLHEGFGVLVEARRELDLAPQDVLVDSHWVVVVEGVDTGVHLIDENTQSPPVDGLPVALIEDDLGGDVFGGAADREGAALVEDLGEAEVSELQVAVIGHQQVLRLQIPEDDVFAMEIFERRGHSSRIEP